MTMAEEVAHATTEFKMRMAREAGGLLDPTAAAELLGWSVEQVQHAATERRLLAVEADKQLFPACQFVDARPLQGLAGILAAAPDTPGWRMLQYLLVPEEGLAGSRPIDLIQGTQEEAALAIRFAARLEA